MLVRASDQVTRRKFSRREAKQLKLAMFTRAQAAATGSTTPKSVTTSLPHTTASVTSGSTTQTSATSDVPPSVSVTITAVATTVSENGIFLTSSASTPVLDTPTITSFVLNSLEGVHSGVPTRTTPTLTPTTLRNIEQTFLELSTVPQPPESHTNQAGFVPPLIHPSSGSTFVSVDNKCWGGGTLTQVANTSSSSSSSSSGVLVPRSAPSLASHSATSTFTTLSSLTMPSQVQQPPRRTGGRRPIKDERLSAEEEERKCMRRERNKMAAARCRKRRLDQTNTLQDETDDLEDRKSELQTEIQLLQQQRDELEFLLATHKAVCRRRLHNATPVTTAVANVVPITTAPHVLTAPPALIASPSVTHIRVKSVPVMVKEEPIEEDEFEDEHQIRVGMRPRRPTSLNVAPVALRTPSVADLGVPIETPSAGLRGLNFESMMDGGTGLTPVTSGTGLTPLHTGLTPLTTPVVSAPTASASSNCGTQQRSSSSDLSSPDSVPPKLVSL